eukprot:763893-Hanusia_phi.AAC.3
MERSGICQHVLFSLDPRVPADQRPLHSGAGAGLKLDSEPGLAQPGPVRPGTVTLVTVPCMRRLPGPGLESQDLECRRRARRASSSHKFKGFESSTVLRVVRSAPTELAVTVPRDAAVLVTGLSIRGFPAALPISRAAAAARARRFFIRASDDGMAHGSQSLVAETVTVI